MSGYYDYDATCILCGHKEATHITEKGYDFRSCPACGFFSEGNFLGAETAFDRAKLESEGLTIVPATGEGPFWAHKVRVPEAYQERFAEVTGGKFDNIPKVDLADEVAFDPDDEIEFDADAPSPSHDGEEPF